jgi:methylated-DNA-protein-cysteine methyltransferase-like protein
MESMMLNEEQRKQFYQTVWEIARQIPSGKVATYGQIAAFIPTPPGIPAEVYQGYRARWVGNAMAACPRGVPWQRVLNSQGKISARQGADEQRLLLENEGVVFDQSGKMDLKKHTWTGPNADWLKARNLLVPDNEIDYGPLFRTGGLF